MRAGFCQLLRKILCVVIEANIKAQHLCGMSAFLCPTSHTYYPTAFKLTDLPNRCANRPGCGLEDDKEMLEDLVAAAFNDAARRIEETQKEKMASVSSGMQLPPGFKMPF